MILSIVLSFVSSVSNAFELPLEYKFSTALRGNDVDSVRSFLHSNKELIKTQKLPSGNNGLPHLVSVSGSRGVKIELVKLLIENGADVNEQFIADQDSGYFKAGQVISTPLSAAIGGMHSHYIHPKIKTAEAYFKKQIKLYKLQGQHEMIKLMNGDQIKATRKQRLGIIAYLISQGADVNAETSRGPLLYTTLLLPTDMPNVIELLIKSGANQKAIVTKTKKNILESLIEKSREEDYEFVNKRITLLKKYLK